jgi:hypothetical protein
MTKTQLLTEDAPHSDGLKMADKHVEVTQEMYTQEREKRLRPSARSEYLDLHSLERFRHFKNDKWAEEEEALNPDGPLRPDDGSHCEILIIGGGWSGLVTAVRLLEAGFKLDDIRIVDFAAGFGGTWCKSRLGCTYGEGTRSHIFFPQFSVFAQEY